MMAIVRFGDFLTLTVAVMIVVFIVGFFTSATHGGRVLYAIGGNAEVARLAGINVQRATVLVYVVCSFPSRAFSGMVLAGCSTRSSRRRAYPTRLDASRRWSSAVPRFPAAPAGSAGTIIGCLIIGVLRNGLNL